MSLDTKQKRGSAISIGMPHRQWLAEPDGNVNQGARLSLLKLCSAVSDDIEAPSVPGAEWVLGNDRTHWVVSKQKLNWVLPADRTHWTVPEE